MQFVLRITFLHLNFMDINKIKNIGKKLNYKFFKNLLKLKKAILDQFFSIFDVVNCLYLGKFIKKLKK